MELIRQAVDVVMGADVISWESKHCALARLASYSSTLRCPSTGCRACANRCNCERQVEGILAAD